MFPPAKEAMREALDCAEAEKGFELFDAATLAPFLGLFLLVWGWLCVQFCVYVASWVAKLKHEHRRYKFDLATRPRDPAILVVAAACFCRFVYFVLLLADSASVGNGACAALGASVVAKRSDHLLVSSDEDIKETALGYAKGPFVNLMFYPIMLAGYTLVYALWYHQTIEIATAHKKNQALRKKATTFDGGAPSQRGPKMLVDTDALSYDSLQMFFGLQCGLVCTCVFFLVSATADPSTHRTLIDACTVMVAIGMLVHCVVFFIYGRVLSGSQEAHLTNLEYRYEKMDRSILAWLAVAILQFVTQSKLDGVGHYVVFLLTCFFELYASLNMIASLYSRDDIARKPRTGTRKSTLRASTSDVESASEPGSLATIPELPKRGWAKWVMQLEPFALVLACEAIDRHEAGYHAKASVDPTRSINATAATAGAAGAGAGASAISTAASSDKQSGPEGWTTLHQSTAITKILDGEVVNPVQQSASGEEQSPVKDRDLRRHLSTRLSGRALYGSGRNFDFASPKTSTSNDDLQRSPRPSVDHSPAVTPKSSAGAGGSLTQRPSDSSRLGHRKSVFDRINNWRSDSRAPSESRPTEDAARSQSSVSDLREAMRIFAKFGVQKVLSKDPKLAKTEELVLAIKAKMLKSVLVEFGYWPREDEVFGWEASLVATNDCNLITFSDFVSFWQSHPILSNMSLVDDVLRPRRKAAQIYTKHLLSFAREADEQLKEPAPENPPEIIVATPPKQVVQLADLVLTGVLPPQVLPSVHAELSSAYEEEKLALPSLEVFAQDTDAAQVGVFFHDYIRIVSTVIAEQTAFEPAPVPSRTSRSTRADEDIRRSDSKFEVTL